MKRHLFGLGLGVSNVELSKATNLISKWKEVVTRQAGKGGAAAGQWKCREWVRTYQEPRQLDKSTANANSRAGRYVRRAAGKKGGSAHLSAIN